MRARNNGGGLVSVIGFQKRPVRYEASIDPGSPLFDRACADFTAGVLGGEIAHAAGEHGLVPVLGQCPDVGMAGVTLGGGLSGLFGASCDNILSARVITADERTRDVSAECDPDLFWDQLP